MENSAFWHLPIEQLYEQLGSRPQGLSQDEARLRLKKYGPNSLKPPQRARGLILFLSQFKSPLIWLLIGAAILSFLLGGRTDSIVIFIIVAFSGLLGYFQERGAIKSIEKLLQMVEIKAMIRREGKDEEISVDQVVPGDILVLNVGDIVPADSILIDANRLFVDESTLTGESAPVEKSPGICDENRSRLRQTNALFMGTVISGGTAFALVVNTGLNTEYGHIAETVRFHTPETAFENGVRKFGYFLMIVTSILVVAIFLFNIYFQRPMLESFLFSLALAVGLTPQLLPAIITVNLSHGARKMAEKRVVIKRLASIENFGQMDVLCADKTGTVTIGKIHLDRAVGSDGKKSETASFFGFINAATQTSYTNPLDQAILDKISFDTNGWNRIDEIPYDFNRKRLSVIFEHDGKEILVAKGAVPQMLAICSQVEYPGGKIVPLNGNRQEIENYFVEQSSQGFRTLAIAYGEGRNEENLTLIGFLHFMDPLKPDIMHAVEELKRKGVQLKIITGDYHAVASHIAHALGMTHAHMATGEEIENADEETLKKIVKEKNIFAEIEPSQKEKIVLAMRKAGHVVGYLGDGVNDVAALHNADVSIAVDSGADAAKAASDIVLLEKDLSVLRAGVEEGRMTFANTLKYVYMAASANFGNMFSMAGASLFLPFLPLLPKQVLLTNLLTDFPEMAIATDRVDPEMVVRPLKWNLPYIRKFMIVFGLISSLFDYATFGVLLYVLKADEQLFQTGWFVESVVSATLIVLAIRTRKSLFRSKPGRLLAFAVFAVAIGVLFIPFTPLGTLFNFVPLPLFFYGTLAGIVFFYILSVEIAKRYFYHRHP